MNEMLQTLTGNVGLSNGTESCGAVKVGVWRTSEVDSRWESLDLALTLKLFVTIQ
jgi:hypothetical protein